MTIRAVLLGLLGASAIAGLSYFNDWVLRQTSLISNNLPISVFGSLVLFVLVFNPLLFRLRKRWALTGAELAVAIALTLAACAVPGAGLMRTFLTTLMMPHKFAQTESGWKGDREAISLADVENWSAFGARLADPDSSPVPAVVRTVAQALPDDAMATVRALASAQKVGVEKRRSLLEAVNAVLRETNLNEAAEVGVEEAPAHIRTRLGWRQDEIEYVKGLLAQLPGRLETKTAAMEEAETRLAPELERLKELRAKADGMAQAIRPELDSLRERRDAGELDKAAYAAQRAMVEAPLDALKAEIAELEDVTYEVDALRHQVKVLRNALGIAEDGTDGEGETERALNLLVQRTNRLLFDAGMPDAVDPRSEGAVESAPPRLLADLYVNSGDALGGYVRGMAIGDRHIPLYKVPWSAWERPFWFWLPVILSLWFGLIALAVVVHRQWASHEQLPYPIAAFTDSLLPEAGKARGPVFSDNLFWLGAGIVFLIHMNNYIVTWVPGWIQIPTRVELFPLRALLPSINEGGGWWFFNAFFYFTPIAFAYFLSTDVSLSLAVGPLLFVYLVGMLGSYGISIGRGGSMSLSPAAFLGTGAYIGIFGAMMYTGRQYYKTVFGRALFLPMQDQVESRAVWAARIFLVALAIFVGTLVVAGLDWQLAVIYAVGMVIIYLVMSRIIAETGLFFIQVYFSPCMVIVSVLGARALGPETMLLLFMITTMLKIDPRESLMPFMINNVKILDQRRVRYGRASVLCGLAVVVALAVAIPVTLYQQYDQGANVHSWMGEVVPKAPFKEMTRLKRELEQTNNLQVSRTVSGWERFAEAIPRTDNLIALAVGLGLTVLFTAGRLHFARWPLHPVLFLVWITYPATRFAWSFFAGWLIKVMVTKYGGSGLYNRLKPLMFGLIAGDMLGGFLPAIVAWIYFWITNDIPTSFNIMQV